ncbi:hypothetical protein PVAND_001551 [Polypedilum vanderplanki]|uniref:ZAD domain-containing protein n=1 Tax=Polypedilum vanderplanki TaxID=319348 RepID=A0A9J6BNS2_POLVA|nr:hypothetical protein PVAND_001551 [Polypedilum vanderplanki]
MAFKTAIDLIDNYKQGYCDICGIEEVNQFFNINHSYIGYLGIFLPLREILFISLGIKIDHSAGTTMEICLDCKDKVVKMYHFKKRIDEVQKNLRSKRKTIQQETPKISEKHTKIVQSIYQIIENYTKKCKISAIRVNENGKRLIIESSSSFETKESVNKDFFEQSTSFNDALHETPMIIKPEPTDATDVLVLANSEEDDGSDIQEDEQDDSDTWRLPNSKKRVSFKRASTSTERFAPTKKSKILISSPTHIKMKKINIGDYLEKRDKKTNRGKCKVCNMMVVWNRERLARHKLKRLEQCASSTNNVKVPATNETELLKLTEEVTNDEEYGHRLGMELIRIIEERLDGQERTSLYVIRSMIKLMTSQSVYLNMNMSGKASRALNDTSTKFKTIKAPEDFMIFLAKYSSILTGDDEEKSYKDVKKVISRIISDWTRDRKRGIQNFFEREQFKLEKEIQNKEDNVNATEQIFADPLN